MSWSDDLRAQGVKVTIAPTCYGLENSQPRRIRHARHGSASHAALIERKEAAGLTKTSFECVVARAARKKRPIKTKKHTKKPSFGARPLPERATKANGIFVWKETLDHTHGKGSPIPGEGNGVVVAGPKGLGGAPR